MAEELALTSSALTSAGPSSNPLGGFSLSDLTGDIGEGLGIAMLKPARAIGTIVPDCVIDEQGRDDLEITRHPIETGAPITDHAFKLPSEVVIRAGWSDSGSMPGYSKQAYEALRALQYKRTPFSLITGKKTFTNMLIASISQTTNPATEHGLVATIVCREVIIVESQTVDVGSRATQQAPQATAGTENGGDRQATPAGSTTPSSATTAQPAGITRLWRGVSGAVNTASFGLFGGS